MKSGALDSFSQSSFWTAEGATDTTVTNTRLSMSMSTNVSMLDCDISTRVTTSCK